MFVCVQLSAQYHMPVYNVTSYQTAQNGSEVGNSIDGDVETIYHSKWNTNAIPDTLTFYFNDQVPEIDRIRYIPRKEGYNGVWEKVEVLAASKSNPTAFVRLNSNPIEWTVSNAPKDWVFQVPVLEPFAIKLVVLQAVGDLSSCAEMEFYGPTPPRTDGSVDCEIILTDIKVKKDIKLTISQEGSYASSFQSSENIEKSFDGNLNTLYHSNWNRAYTDLPVELNYHFKELQHIDYFIYYPRNEGYNGLFGEASIYFLDESEGDYVHLMDFDFGLNGLETRVDFPRQLQTYDVKIIVKSGEQGFVSCAEMEFYKKADDGGQDVYPYSNIFNSPLYDGIFDYVSTKDIVAMEPGFYHSLATCILLENYNIEIRSRKFKAYESIAQLSQKLKTSRYDAFENPTGLLFEKNDTVVIFASEIGSDPIYLRVVDFANEENPDDYAYQLINGINIIVMRGVGLGYISYYSNNPTISPEVSLNIVNGKINGYYDSEQHTKADWISLMSRNTYKKVDLIGKYVHLNYDRLPLKVNSPYDGAPLIQLYDSIVQWQRIQMGLYKYNYGVNNRMFGVSGTGGGWYAGGQGIHLDLTWGPSSITKASELDMWGIPHEFGHVNQIRPGLRWIGTTEVTNNVYAVWANYNLNREKNKYTRLESESFSMEGSPRRVMNRYNTIINELFHQDSHLQETKDDYPFRLLIPFWQLQLYYQLAGACRDALPLTFEEQPPIDDIDYAHWYATVAEKVRTTDVNGLDNGELLLNFVKYTCDAVKEDLTDFFIRMGFLRPVDVVIDDYGNGRLKITQPQIDQVVQQIKASYSSQPVSPVIHYISALTVNTYRDKEALTGKNGEGYTLHLDNSNPYIEIDHKAWKHSVAFESYDGSGGLLRATLTGTGDLTNQRTFVPFLLGTDQIYAVGYDGVKILVWPKVVSVSDEYRHYDLKVIPNLIGGNETIRLENNTITGPCSLIIYNAAGHIIYQETNTLETLNNNIGKVFFTIPGIYYVYVNTEKEIYQSRFISIR